MKVLVRVLAALSLLYLIGALVKAIAPSAFPFEAVAWVGLILIFAWAWIDGKKEAPNAYRARTVV